MAEFPKFPLWTDAYLGDTTHLRTVEHGAYLLLLIAMWRTREKALPNNDRLLARYARMTDREWRDVKPIIMPFFTIEGENITQLRLRDEAEAAAEYAGKQARRAKSRWLKSKETSGAAAPTAAQAAAMPDESHGNASLSLSHTEKPEGSSVEARKRAPAKTAIRADAVLGAAEWGQAEAKGLSREEAEAQFVRFRDSAIAAGRRYADWGAAWRNWLTSDYFRPLTNITPIRRGNSDGPGLDDHLDALKARLAVRRLE